MRKTSMVFVPLVACALSVGHAAGPGPFGTPAPRPGVAFDREGDPGVLETVGADPSAGEPGDASGAFDWTAPTILEVLVYSRTAGEIVWDVRETPGVLYEVTRDGLTVATKAGTSHFDDTLEAGRTYTYRVLAIGREGQRSEADSVTLTTRGDAAAVPAAPTGLTARVYSSTAGEIFWTRSSTLGLTYDVMRDGRMLATKDGTSYFDDTLVAGERHVYDVVAVDREGRRSATSSVTLRARGGTAADLAPPRVLDARVYSGTAGEIFWDRRTTPDVLYEVTRDGRTLATVDGTSYFDDTLEAGHVYTYRVVAIDREGLRSAADSVTLVARGDAKPTGLEARAYSRTAGEIFWTRSPAFGLVHEVTRDGRTLATTEGTSYFDGTLEAGRRHAYDVVAIDRAGRRSPPARVTLTAPGSVASTSMISRASYEGLVAHAFELYVGARYNAPLLPLLGPPGDVLSAAPNDDNTLDGTRTLTGQARYDCESGRAELDLTRLGPYDDLIVQFRFEDCLDRGVLRDGTIDANVGDAGADVSSEGLGVETGPDHALRFSGHARRGVSRSRSYYSPSWETVDLSLVGRDGEGEFVLRGSNTHFEFSFAAEPAGFDDASLSGSFSIRSEATGGRDLFVSTPLDFHYFWDVDEPPGSSGGQVPRDDPSAPWDRYDATDERRDDWYFASGQLELVGEDGSRLLLDADTGDATTVRIAIDDGRGADTFETSWAPWQRLLRLAP